jgi:hypothetical protein
MLSKLQFLKEKKSSCECFSIFGHQKPGSETGSGFGSALGSGSGYGSAIRKNARSVSVSGSALNQCGFTTLDKSNLFLVNEI